MASYKVEICGVNTAKLPILKEEEKDALFARIKQGDTAARETYIKGNLRLVLSVIKRFSGNHENVDDLFQIGCIGLIKSIDNFDPTIGVKFSTYAVPMIIGEIRRYLRDNNSIRVSRSLRDTAYKAIHTKEILSKTENKEPTLDEIAAESGISKEDIVFALDAIQSPLSLYDPVYTDGGDTLYVMDQISDKKNREENWVEELSLNDALDRLNERENYILKLRFFEGKTQMEVADEIHISQAQVSRLEKSALSVALTIPFIAQSIDLICKFAKFFVWHSLTLIDNREKSLACSKQSCKYIARCTALLCYLLLCPFSGSFAYLFAGCKVKCISRERRIGLIPQSIFQMIRELLRNFVFPVYHKYFFRLIFECCRPFCQLFHICVAADTRQVLDSCRNLDCLTKEPYLFCTI
jgi:RNA polymerase sporulation-specific sigma factor